MSKTGYLYLIKKIQAENRIIGKICSRLATESLIWMTSSTLA